MSAKLDDFWQENKRFVLIVAAGAIGFGVGWMWLHSTLGKELDTEKARQRSLETQLAQPVYKPDDLTKAQAERDTLAASVETLRKATAFGNRPEFALDGTSPSNRFFAVAARAREDLATLAGRAGLGLPEGLGLPALSPTKEQEIQRYLEALDLVDRVVRLAIESGCDRIDEIRIKLDSRLASGKSIEDVEKTTVEFNLTGPAAPLVRMLVASEQARFGGVLLQERADLRASTTKNDEAKLEVVFYIAHDHGAGGDGAADDAAARPVEKTADAPSGKPAGAGAGKPAATPAGKSAAKPGDNTVGDRR